VVVDREATVATVDATVLFEPEGDESRESGGAARVVSGSDAGTIGPSTSGTLTGAVYAEIGLGPSEFSARIAKVYGRSPTLSRYEFDDPGMTISVTIGPRFAVTAMYNRYWRLPPPDGTGLSHRMVIW
jgi:hypothetical protein